MRRHQDFPLAELTTLGLGGPAAELVEAESDEELTAVVGEADAAERPVLLIAGGSNLVLPDAGWPDLAVAVRTDGVEVEESGDRVRLSVAAGHDWDALVARCVAEGWSGVECLSGIPGSTGATPIQNVGAYGQEVAETIIGVRALDRVSGERVELAPEQCRFAYRSSAFKGSDRYLVLEVVFELERSPLSGPSPTRSSPSSSASSRASGRRWPRSARRCSGCAAARAWSSTRPTRTRAAPAPSSPTRSSAPAEHEALAERVAAELGARDRRPGLARSRRRRQDLGRLADRAGRLRPRLRRGAGRHLDQALAGARQPRRRDHRRAARPRPRDPRRRPRAVRGRADARADPGRGRAVEAARPGAQSEAQS